MLVQGSAGGSASSACSSSMEMPSGVRTKAMRPSRGGRLIVTPRAIVGVPAFLVRTAAELAQAEHLEEGDGFLQRTDAYHGVQILVMASSPVCVFVAARQNGR
jgi:hypothetical protein